MSNILDTIFNKCVPITDKAYEIFKRKEITEHNAKLHQRAKEFEMLIEDDNLRKRFKDFCEEEQELFFERDADLADMFLRKGMSLQTRLLIEILTE